MLSVTGIQNENAVILINDIFQGPGLNADYTLSKLQELQVNYIYWNSMHQFLMMLIMQIFQVVEL
jgi:hypothetical protein